MRTAISLVITSMLAACVSTAPALSTSPGSATENATLPDHYCQEEKITGSNLTRIVCFSRTVVASDREQQIRTLNRPNADPMKGN